MNAFQKRDGREEEETFASMGTALFHTKREARLLHDSLDITANHAVIRQASLLVSG